MPRPESIGPGTTLEETRALAAEAGVKKLVIDEFVEAHLEKP